MTTHCPTCGSRVTIHGDETEGTMYYQPIAFSGHELDMLQLGLGELAKQMPGHLPIAALRTRVLELAFMEVSRDA